MKLIKNPYGRRFPARSAAGSFKKKALILFGVLAFCLIAYFFIARFFYILNSYVYTAEFHWLFLTNNLKAEKVSLLSEYFKALGPVGCLPNLFLAQFISAFINPFSWPVLTVSTINAFGLAPGILLNLISVALMGMCAFGLGIFFTGDIIALSGKTSFSPPHWMIPALFLLLCIPYLTILLPAILAAVFKIRFRHFFIFMIPGLLIRIALIYVH